MTRALRIVYFAWVRERIGVPEETVTPPDGIVTVADLARWLASRDERYAHAFENAEIVRAAIDHTHVRPDTPIGDAREIAFFPPMTGG